MDRKLAQRFFQGNLKLLDHGDGVGASIEVFGFALHVSWGFRGWF